MPTSPNHSSRIPVASDEAATAATLLPKRIAPISCSRAASRRLMIFARLSPCWASACMRAREEAVSAVSLPEKKNEARRQTTTATSEAISKGVMGHISKNCPAPRRASREQPESNALRDFRLADAAREDEHKGAVPDLLVLR